MDPVLIRERQPADLDRCVAALRAVHEADAYPLNWPADPAAWLTPPSMSVAWIAELPGGAIAGHVAVQDTELSRLFVTPEARRSSVATALVDRARSWAGARKLTLVVTEGRRSAAVAFYEAAGWRYTHSTDADWTAPDGSPVRLGHYHLLA
jgi:GNAT superfamily N-acetyltransferase